MTHAPLSTRRYSATQLRLLAVSLPAVALTRLALWVLPSTTLVRAARRLESGAVVRPVRAAVHDVTWAIAAASRLVPRASCLTQALAGLVMLRRNGHDAQLCIGAGRDRQGEFRAHAWLEQGGRILLGGGDLRDLVRFPTLGSTRPAEGVRTHR